MCECDEDVVVVVVYRLQHVEFKNTRKTHLRPSWKPGGREKIPHRLHGRLLRVVTGARRGVALVVVVVVVVVSSFSLYIDYMVDWPRMVTGASRHSDLSTKSWTGHQVENNFFVVVIVVEIDPNSLVR
jgi:hypothetical protein